MSGIIAGNPQSRFIGKDLARRLKQYMSNNPGRELLYKYLRTEVFPIKPSQYDMSAICNLRCEGCLYYSGDYFDQDLKYKVDDSVLHEFYKAEKERGVNFPHFGGAEPALRQNVLHVASNYFDRGVVYTNGSIKISDDINFMRHISVWGGVEDTKLLRGLDIFETALNNYKYDDRAVFVLMVSKKLIKELPDLIKIFFNYGVKVTFNFYSPTSDYLKDKSVSNKVNSKSKVQLIRTDVDLLLDADSLKEVRGVISNLIEEYPKTVVFSQSFNEWVTREDGVYSIDPDTGWATSCASRLNNTMRHYLPDLSQEVSTKCCTPNIECSTCRLYSMAYASAIDSLPEFSNSVGGFGEWLDITSTWCRLFLRERDTGLTPL